MWVTKHCCGNKRNYWHPKGDSCWLDIFSAAQKRNANLQEMVPVVHVLYWLKKFCVARKILSCRAKIKNGVHKFY